jgi:cytochrome c-type biogenesis protein CcsB
MTGSIDVNLFYSAFVVYSIAMVVYFGSFWKKEGKAVKTGKGLLLVGFIVQLAGLAIRSVNARFMPVTNMYESLNFFSAAIVLVYILTEKRTGRSLGVFVLPVVFLLMAFTSLPSTNKEIMPLIPALQSQWLVWHVVFSFVGEACFAVAFGASVMYILRTGAKEGSFISKVFPSPELTDQISYRAISFGFPVFTLGALIFGAVWAKYAWGSYWSWDPKETWALITWLVYALYLHARIQRGWKGRGAAVLSIIGFLATMFTLFGVNYLLSGLHSYT